MGRWLLVLLVVLVVLKLLAELCTLQHRQTLGSRGTSCLFHASAWKGHLWVNLKPFMLLIDATPNPVLFLSFLPGS